MTEPEPAPSAELSYRAPGREERDFGLGSWISLIAFGALEIGGFGCFTLAVFAVFMRKLAAHPRSPAMLYRAMVFAGIIYFGIPLLAAGAKLLCVPKIRRGSLPALITATAVTATQAIGGIVAFVLLILLFLKSPPSVEKRGYVLLSVIACGLTVAWGVHACVLLWALLRDRKRRRAAGME